MSATGSPWFLAHEPLIGTLLLALMVGLVIWRALTKQPTSVAEVIVGVIGLLLLLAPVLDNLSFEGMGVKVSAKLKSIQETAVTNAEVIGRLDARLTALEGRTSTNRAETPVAKTVSTLIYFRDGGRQEATKLRDSLIAQGFPASVVATDFSEIKDPPPSGTVRLVYRDSAKAAIPKIGDIVKSVVDSDRVVVNPESSPLSNGQVQVWMF
jgi:hypothetical protein